MNHPQPPCNPRGRIYELHELAAADRMDRDAPAHLKLVMLRNRIRHYHLWLQERNQHTATLESEHNP